MTAPTPRRPLLALALLLPVPSIGAAAGLWWWPGEPLGQILFGMAKLWILVLPAVWFLKIDRAPRFEAPLPKKGWGLGLASGLAFAAVIGGAYLLFGEQLIDRDVAREALTEAGFHGLGPYVAMAVYWSTVNALLEEYVWRWFVVRQGRALLGTGGAVLLSALGFTAHHVVAMSAYLGVWPTLLASLGVFAGGLIWSLLYARLGNVWPVWLSHLLADVAVFACGAHLLFGSS